MKSKKGQEDAIFALGMFIGALGIVVVLYFAGAFDSSINNLDKDKIVKDYALQYYPEYVNCSFKYSHNGESYTKENVEAIIIFCNNLSNRDGLEPDTSKIAPTLVLKLKNITLNDIIKQKLEAD